jgi:hypothetical protein
MNWPRLLSDLILILHTGFIAFVLFGLVVVWLGIALRWQWVRNFYFRAAHLLAIGYVVAQAWLGVACPLTIWENDLRVRGGQSAYGEGGFIAHWLHRLIFFNAEPWVFTTCYTVFGLLVVGTLVFGPPRLPAWLGRRRHGSAGNEDEQDRPDARAAA